ncbi:hypothetical protein FALBO_3219 [Fusarium albosuccineum]|uniref:DUF3669 domain-containing protein n=1 Tax=Fusarium albosuccineum TaxID=1237068 RepID=A0A8H4LIQ8_9HYPO|nr:hypothetical protein FALBO_3219 [Fusarium albosuccineum]
MVPSHVRLLGHADLDNLENTSDSQIIIKKELSEALDGHGDADKPPSCSLCERDPGILRKIGAGACGAVFAQDERPLAIKLAKSSNRDDLWNDFLMHKLIYGHFEAHGITCVGIPQCPSFVPKERACFWEENPGIYEAAEPVCQLPTHGLISERIQPVDASIRRLLLERFCPDSGRIAAETDPANRDCLVRIYLGSLQGRAKSAFFSLRNFKLHLNQMLDMKLSKDFLSNMASKMATALAVMHWAARTDARDVEFALGGTTKGEGEAAGPPPNSWAGPRDDATNAEHTREIALWLLDFNQVRPITMDEAGVAQAVEAFKINDPYYPRPFQEDGVSRSLWETFVRDYKITSDRILEGCSPDMRMLPQLFVEQVTEMQRRKLTGS